MSDSGIRVTELRAEEVTTLAPPSEGQLNKIVKLETKGTSKAYICMQNSVGDYEWVQMAIST
ncbi:hypothetical protein ES707_13987 [subsurface metagenome]